MKVVTQLKGGLGNQLFQYAAARAAAEQSKAELVLDTWSGFARDFDYGRTYGLGGLPISARPASAIERLPFWLQHVAAAVKRRAALRPIHNLSLFGPGNIRAEPSEKFYDGTVLDHRIDKNIWMSGYWQSPRYFDRITDRLVAELSPAPPSSPRALALGDDMRTTASVAIGIRLYEESSTPDAHSRDGKAKTIEDINRAVDRMSETVGHATYYVFCSHRAEALERLRVPSPPVFVTGQDGFEDPIESLWLLAQCRHHILTNSTFYWWGAWLAENSRPAEARQILAADNFINQDSLPAHWSRF